MLAATHRELKQRVVEGLFREDLYYRLAVVPIAVPPLRERRDDIAALAVRFAVEFSQSKRRLSRQALDRLTMYSFPGNVRELRNLIERACILSASDEIGPEHFPGGGDGGSSNAFAGEKKSWLSCVPADVKLRPFLAEVEKTLIEQALDSSNGAQAEAARRLGLSRSDLAYKIAKYDIVVPVEIKD